MCFSRRGIHAKRMAFNIRPTSVIRIPPLSTKYHIDPSIARVIFCLYLHFERWFKPLPQEETPYKSEMTLCIFGNQVRKNFPTVHMCILFWYSCNISFCRDLRTEYIVTTAFQSYPTTKNVQVYF